jgi:hypothetical protein
MRVYRVWKIPSVARGAVWALRARRRVVRALDAGRAGTIDVPESRRIGATGIRGVRLVLRTFGDRCLVDALVRQRWHAAHGSKRALMIGVTSPASGFAAHAWLEGDPPAYAEGFTELSRRSA